MFSALLLSLCRRFAPCAIINEQISLNSSFFQFPLIVTHSHSPPFIVSLSLLLIKQLCQWCTLRYDSSMWHQCRKHSSINSLTKNSLALFLPLLIGCSQSPINVIKWRRNKMKKMRSDRSCSHAAMKFILILFIYSALELWIWFERERDFVVFDFPKYFIKWNLRFFFLSLGSIIHWAAVAWEKLEFNG